MLPAFWSPRSEKRDLGHPDGFGNEAKKLPKITVEEKTGLKR
jgi:hypothetical protein